MMTCIKYLDKKTPVLTFGMDLEAIWDFQIFGYLDKKMPTVTRTTR